MILTTTNTIEGKEIAEYIGLVTGNAILGANIFKDLFADIRNIIGGRSAAYEGELNKARDLALKEIEEVAKSRGANAVIGIDLDFATVGQGMLMVNVSGTAVKIR